MKLYFKKSYCLKKSTPKENFFWNMLGSMASSVTSMIFSVIVARTCSPAQSDSFSIAYAIAATIWTVANFESGTLMVTDVKDKYSHSDYFWFKISLVVLSTLSTLVVLIFNFAANKYDVYKCSVVFLFCIYRITEAFSNHYYSVFQKKDHINVAGFSMFLRTVITLICFVLSLLISHNLIISIFLIFIICLGWTFFYEMNFSSVYGKITHKIKFVNIAKLFLECLPLFLSSFLISYLINMPKFSIDAILSNDAGVQTAYNAIFQPAAIINLFCLFIFRPTLVGLAEKYNNKEYKNYILSALKIVAVVFAFSVIALICISFLGIPVLQLLYGATYINNNLLLPLIYIIIGGVFYALSQLLYNMITVIRCQYYMLFGYALALAFAFFMSNKLVLNYGINGAAAMYMISMILLTFLFLIIFVISFSVLREKEHGKK